MRHNWPASLKNFVGSTFTHSVFLSSVIGHIFACVCEVQLRLRKIEFYSYNSCV